MAEFLGQFNFADWRFFVFCGNYFLRLEKTGFSCWELIFVFSGSGVQIELIKFSFFIGVQAKKG